MTKAYVLSVDPYSVVDETTGKMNSGYTIWFLNRYRDNTTESKGHKPVKVSVPADSVIGQKLMQTELPAVCDLEIDVRPGAGNKLAAMVSALQILAPVPLEKIFAAIPASTASR